MTSLDAPRSIDDIASLIGAEPRQRALGAAMRAHDPTCWRRTRRTLDCDGPRSRLDRRDGSGRCM